MEKILLLIILRPAIAAEHTLTPDFESTNWVRLLELYNLLLEIKPFAGNTIKPGRGFGAAKQCRSGNCNGSGYPAYRAIHPHQSFIQRRTWRSVSPVKQ